MKNIRQGIYLALLLSLVIHLGLLAFWFFHDGIKSFNAPHSEPDIVIKLQKPISTIDSQNNLQQPTSKEAPPAPTAEEWAFASHYTLKNSKGYRYNWGKQVRSMMGTATAGPDQGQVRFAIEIAPNGSIVKVETLWKTSDVAEKLARKAIQSMSALPPTPTGKPLIFERTISFTPYADDDAPIYRDDCLPDTQAFTNPFVWDGKSPQTIAKPVHAEPPNPQALAECLKQLPQDTAEGIAANIKRQLNVWDSPSLSLK
jgi:hypothetical protein